MKYKKLVLIISVIFIIIFTACSSPETRLQDQLDIAIAESFSYSEFYNDGFSIQYPVWPASDSNIELSVTRGYCSVSVNVEKIPAESWYDMIIKSVNEQNGKIIELNKDENYIRYSGLYQNFTMISENRIYDCNYNANAVTITCIEQAYPKTQDMRNIIFNSAKCNGQETTGKSEVIYKTYTNSDFSINYPDWDKINDNSNHEVAVSRGICSVLVDKYNALPKDIYEWDKNAIKDNKDNNLLDSSSKGDIYYLTYDMPYEDKTITSETKIFYCNYESYITQVLCINGLVTDEYKEIREKVLESSKCSKEYEASTQEDLKKKAEQDNPGAIEEIGNEIVKTNAGQEFGIDEEAVVYFINNNLFFTKIMKDFPKANIVIEDTENNRELDLRVTIDESGKIKILEDGQFSDADVSLIVPLRDALNIFGNAQNINPITLIGFAVNVRTEPPEIKNQVIQKVIRGEYN
ncbi:MAG: hypothetical protein KKD48_02050 [Nanoarchaeota archaeon]|nr:hypothetical protein [Nanoarchaeota archaeon]